MIRIFFRTGLLCLGFFLALTPGLSLANVEAVGTPLVGQAVRQWEAAFTKANGIRASYTNSLEDISTTELFVGIYDLAVVEFPSASYRLEQLGLIQFPLFGFGVAVVANVPGVHVGDIKLNGKILAEIYMGKITRWDHPEIAKINQGLHLPSLAITPVAQSDGSITTFNFTRYLSDGSEEWQQRIGLGAGLIWPLGEGEKDSRAAAQKVLEISGAIGFQSAMNVASFKLDTTQLQNKLGNFVSISNARVKATMDQFIDHPERNKLAPVNLVGDGSWPIVSIIYGQMKRVPEDIPDALETVQFLTWAFKNAKDLEVQEGLQPVQFKAVEPTLNLIETKKTFDGRAAPQRK